MTDLFPHQAEGVVFLKEKKRAILADEMGLGKTRQAIVAAEEDSAGEDGVILQICPASLKINWEREIHQVYPETPVCVVQSGKEAPLPEEGWIVINYDMLPKYQAQLMGLKERGMIRAGILDEAHYIKGKKTKRALLALELILGLPRVYVLTGTPIMNRPAELFNLLRAINHPLGKRKSFFSKRYCNGHLKTIVKKDGRIIRFWDETGAARLPELHTLTQDVILRRKKEEVLDLPEKIISVEIVELDKEGQREYDEAWDRYLSWVESHPEGKNIENILSAQSLVELMKLKQVCSRAKIGRMVADIANAVDQENKVIVFSQFTGTIDAIREKLLELNIASVRLTGEDDSKRRQEAVDRFQNDPEMKVFVANIKAGGVGLNLTAASQVMFADMDWSPALHDQATDRAHRIGQQGTVNAYYYVVAETIEEDIVEILQRKLATIQAIVEGREDYEDGSLGAEFLERLKDRIMGTTH